MIISEIGDFRRFSSRNKTLSYIGLSTSTYQLGQLNNCYSHMGTLSSQYLRYALFIVATQNYILNNTFSEDLSKKRNKRKHYYVAISNAVKKKI